MNEALTPLDAALQLGTTKQREDTIGIDGADGWGRAYSLSEQWVERATSPCRWATCPAEGEGHLWLDQRLV